MAEVLGIVTAFLGWILQVLNALDIHKFDEQLSKAIDALVK